MTSILIISKTLGQLKGKTRLCATICTLLVLVSSKAFNLKTSCPPSKRGKGNEFKTARLIEIKAANNNIPVPPCCDS